STPNPTRLAHTPKPARARHSGEAHKMNPQIAAKPPRQLRSVIARIAEIKNPSQDSPTGRQTILEGHPSSQRTEEKTPVVWVGGMGGMGHDRGEEWTKYPPAVARAGGITVEKGYAGLRHDRFTPRKRTCRARLAMSQKGPQADIALVTAR